MIFRKKGTQGAWTVLDYSTTWKYGYDFMLDAAQELVDSDFKDNIRRLAVSELPGTEEVELVQAVRDNGNILRGCQGLEKEKGVLFVAGVSTVMEIPLQIVFFNQTDHVRVYCPSSKFIVDNGEHVFDNYMNSIEIKAYVRRAERHAERKYNMLKERSRSIALENFSWPSADAGSEETAESPEE